MSKLILCPGHIYHIIEFFYGLGSEPSRHDSVERSCGRLPFRRSRLASNWAPEPCDAFAGEQLSLPRTETRSDRRIGRLYPEGMENVTKFTKNFRFKCEIF